MKAGYRILVAALLAIWATGVWAAEFSTALDYELEKAQGKDKISAIIILESPIDIQALDFTLHTRKASLAERHAEVIGALKYNAEQTQPAFRAELDEVRDRGELTGYTAYWIDNLFVVHASKDFLESLRNRMDVKYVCENFRPELIEPIRSDRERDPLDTETTTSSQDAIRATEVNRALGITGQGVLVANCDTGVDATHPALASRWRGNTEPLAECWRDALGTSPAGPTDLNGHGTHVMGTITGRAIAGADTNTIGSAPNARWIATNSINQGVGAAFDNDIIADYQWFADPDGNPGTLDDVPDVIQNSWGVHSGFSGYTQCDARWNTFILNCEAAGPVVTWSAGNESTSGLRTPAIHSMNAYQIFSVGAVDAENFGAPYPLAGFSSQGPTPCAPAIPDNIKPEISAPGVDVYSSFPGGGYGLLSGTSMAGPHVAGVVALMREACPNCDHMTIKQAIMDNAIDYGVAGQDNLYGYGFIDAYESVIAVFNSGQVCGFVRDASNNPIQGARVGITTGPSHAFTAADGSYCLTLSEGTYTVVASAFGYITQQSAGVVVTEGNVTTRNFTLPTAATGTVSGVVTDCNGGPSVGATVAVLNTPVPPATTNGAGFYSITLPQGTYDMRASNTGCAAHQVTGVVVGASATQNFTLLSDPIYSCSVPDAYGYYACENGDAGGPTYAWTEIAPSAGGPGTDTGQSCDDCSSGPYNFPFPFMFYGTTYTQYHIGSNGMVTFGAGTSTFSNGCFPQNFQPAGVYAFWDDLYTACSTAELATYYDAGQGRLIIEWYNTCHCCGEGNLENIQVIIYDQTVYPTITGDNNVAIQYGPVSLLSSNTVGIKSANGPFNQYVCNGSLDPNAQGVANGRVILFTTGPGCEAGPSDITVNPPSLAGSAPVGGTDTGSIQICNNGLCPLTWSISWNQTTPAAALSSGTVPFHVEMSKEQIELIEAINRGEKPYVEEDTRSSGSPLDAQGGPDLFGYTWIDSDEPGGPVYNWVEINAIGTNVGITGDDQTVNIALPFTFSFYGTDYNSVNVSSNGNIHFGPANAAFGNIAIPSASAPLAMIAPFWDDLYPPLSGIVYRYYDAANSRFIVQWDNIAHFNTGADRYTFQVILYQSGRILVQYEDIIPGTFGVTTSTIGLNSPTGTDGLQVVFNAAYLHANMAIEFAAVEDWLTITPPVEGVVDPGQCATVNVTFTAGDLPAGTYTGNLNILTNDPDEASVDVPVTFTVGQYDPPANLTIYYLPTTNQLRFEWIGSGAPQYQVWAAAESVGPYDTFIGATAATILTVPYTNLTRQFFVVYATDGAVLGSASLPAIEVKD